jgi:nucleoside-diphosphate-sugar epimerase
LLIALTGTTGFLGRSFAAAALAQGHAVRGLVPPGAGAPPEGVEALPGALGDDAAVRALLRGADALVHLAALGVQSRDRAFERMAQVNVVEPLALLAEAKAAGVRRLVAAGTCLEYSGHGRLPDAPAAAAPRLDEASPAEPADPYGATKAAGGLLLRAHARALGLSAWYLRFASLYGPGDDPAKLLPSAVRAAVARAPFEMTGGAQVREWLHVEDAARALLAALVAEPPEPVALVNAGTGEGVALRDVARLAFEAAGADPSLVRAGARPYRPGDVHHLVMDCARARLALPGWRPATELRRGIEELVRRERARGGKDGAWPTSGS